MSLPRLLVVDDDEQILKQIQWAFSDEYQVRPAMDRTSALDLFKREEISIALLDLGLPPRPREATEGLLALEELIAHNPLVKVVVVSGNSERQNALQAVARGAHDIFPKPVDVDELRVVLRRVLKRVELEQQGLDDRALSASLPLDEMVGSSEVMKSVFASVRKVAAADVPVLIRGESGTGKELIAQAIHRLGPRKDGPFVAINCSAIPENLLESELFGFEKGSFTGAASQRRGKVEYAHHGTLFLDEIGDLAPEMQVKILRFLQEKVIERLGGRTPICVDSRIIAATHRDLEAAVREGSFREDLYFRIAVVKIVLPPLRERGDDIIHLADHMIAAFSREMKRPPKRLSRAAHAALLGHAWPGNVRELQNRVKRALVLAEGQLIVPADLELEQAPPAPAGSTASLREARQEVERGVISRALRDNNGNISRAARSLGISRPTLYELMSRYQL